MYHKYRLIRELQLKKLEMYRIDYFDRYETICYFLVIDCCRPSTLGDFPLLNGIEEEENFGRSNLIDVIIFSQYELSDETKESIETIITDLLENKPDIHLKIDFKTTHFPEEGTIGFGEDVVPFVNRLLTESECFSHIIKEEIPTYKFNYLSQE
jgi:hypothetical protein